MKQENLYIDNRYFFREYSEQGVIILFKKLPLKDDEKYDVICSDILKIAQKGLENLYVSDIISQTKWSDETKSIIQESLYVSLYIKNKNKYINYIAAGVYKKPCDRYDEIEIYEGQKLIARFYIKQYEPISLKKIIIYSLILLCAIGICTYVYPMIEELFNAENVDIKALTDNKSLIKSTDVPNPKLHSSGIPERKTEIKPSDISGADVHSNERQEQKKETMPSVESSSEVHNSEILERKTETKPSDITDADVQSNERREQKKEAKSSDVSSPEVHSSRIPKRKTETKPSNISDADAHSNERREQKKETKTSDEDAQFNELVEKANSDCFNYYQSENLAYAKSAYTNYVEALKIKYDKNIADKCNKLKEDIGL